MMLVRKQASNINERTEVPISHRWLNVSGWSALALALALSLFFNQQYSHYLGGAGLFLLASLASVTSLGFTDRRRLRLPPLLLLAVVFWLWWAFAALFSPLAYVSDSMVWTLAFMPLVGVSTWMLSEFDPFSRFRLLGIFFVFGIGLGLYACLQHFFFGEAPQATFLNKNSLAAFEMLVLFVVLGAWFRHSFRVGAGGYTGSLWAFGTLVFFLSFVIGLIASLGSLIALLSGLLLLVGFSFTLRVRRRLMFYSIILIVGGFLVSSQMRSGALTGKLAVLGAPLESDTGIARLAIWKGSLEMLDGSIWTGIGPGLFWLFYPQHRLPADTSDGFYAHNDYLQFVIEAGLPALAILLALIFLLCWQVIRFLRHERSPSDDRIEVLALFVALASVASHSLVTFNFYQLPIIIICGALIGRLAWLMNGDCGEWSSKRNKRWPFVIAVAVLLSIPASFYLRAIGGGWSLAQAMSASEERRWSDAESHFRNAIAYWPGVDFYHYSLAWILFQKASEPENDSRELLIAQAFKQLEVAQKINPHRSEIYMVKARIMEMSAEKPSGMAPSATVEEAYQKALDLNPRNLSARFFYARYLLKHNQIEAGIDLLESGLSWSYDDNDLKLNYLRLTATLRKIVGNLQGYNALIEEVEDLEEKLLRKKSEIEASGLK